MVGLDYTRDMQLSRMTSSSLRDGFVCISWSNCLELFKIFWKIFKGLVKTHTWGEISSWPKVI